MSFAAAMLIAMALDALLGWPDALFLRIGHPVTWLGRLISTLDGALNRGPLRRLTGVLTALVVIGTAGGLGGLALALMPGGWVGTVLAGVLAWPLVAIRSMHDHVAAVARPLAAGDLAGARQAVSMIVGRDPSTLDSAGVARAATESLAENTSDGIVAPLFWGVVAGLPGIAAYKAINTLDSMIGHKSPRYLQFGWASARIDDVVNLAPARLTVLRLLGPDKRERAKANQSSLPRHSAGRLGWPGKRREAGMDQRYQADVVVVGAGLAGLVAACEAAGRGKRVLLLDQEGEQNLGGQAFWSLGGLFMVDTPEQRRMKIRDSRALAAGDWLGSAQFDGGNA